MTGIFKLITLFLLITIITSIIPGINYNTYRDGIDIIPITVGRMISSRTLFPFNYYALSVCGNDNYSQVFHELGEILTGDIVYTSVYDTLMNKNGTFCKIACKKNPLSEYDSELIKWMIDQDYTTTWYADGLPAGRNLSLYGQSTNDVLHELGIPLGDKVYINDKYKSKIYNHFTFNIFVHHDHKSKNKNTYSVVEFNIVPYSIKHVNETNLLCANNAESNMNNYKNYELFQYVESGEEIIYTYDVVFYDSKIEWASRWDHYLHSNKSENIHWFSILNSNLIILIFSVLIAYIFCRVLKKDIDYINTRALSDDIIDDSSWKQVSKDVFRKPVRPMLLSVLVGTGIQLFIMFSISILFAALGFVSPAKRGSLVTLMILIFVFMGGFAGYASARMYKMFQESEWLKNALLTAFLFPSLAFSTFFIINIFLFIENSSGAVPFTTILTLLVLWICCSTPLVLIGAFIGLKRKPLKNPGTINVVPSFIPQQPWYLSTKVICLISGLIPFGAISIELIYIMGSIWRYYFYYLFGFLFAVIIIMIITSAEISIIVIYHQLSKGNYKWWWKSFLVSGSVSVYILLYSIYYYLTQLKLTRFSSIILYFGYMSLFSITIFLITGSIGLIFTYLFLKKIYSLIKID